MSIFVTYQDLKKLSRELFLAMPETNTLEELDAGMKCFQLAWLNCTFPDTPLGEIQQKVEHPILIKIVTREYFKHEIRIEQMLERS